MENCCPAPDEIENLGTGILRVSEGRLRNAMSKEWQEGEFRKDCGLAQSMAGEAEQQFNITKIFFGNLGAFPARSLSRVSGFLKPGFPLQFRRPRRGLAVFPLQSLARLQTGAFFHKTGHYLSCNVKLLEAEDKYLTRTEEAQRKFVLFLGRFRP
jgi:hypothetical protein